MSFSVKVENPHGLNRQKITIRRKKKEDGTSVFSDSELGMIHRYLENEGFFYAAKQHNVYFNDEFDQ
jgi:hypothetical protein